MDSTSSPIYLSDNAHTIDGTPENGQPIVGAPSNAPVNGMQCVPTMPGTTHYHVHVTLVVNNQIVTLPSGTGIYNPQVVDFHDGQQSYFVNANTNGGCYYETHVHAPDGVVHIESAQSHYRYAFGAFLDVWGRMLSPGGFGPYSGPTRWFDTDESTGTPGSYVVKEMTGTDPHLVPMLDHHEYTIEVNSAMNIRNFTFSSADFATYGYP